MSEAETAGRPDPGLLTEQWPVLVVGAGPAGLVAAISLARYGIRCLVVNRRTSVSPLPRATALTLRTMEQLRVWGIEGEIRAGGDDVELQLLLAPSLSLAAEGEVVEVGFPSSAASARLSPTRPACVPQDHVESVLLAHLRQLPAATVATGTEVLGIVAAGSGSRVLLRDVATGELRHVQARYVVAADGANSPIRDMLGIGTSAVGASFVAMSATIRAPLWELVGDRRFVIYHVDGAADGSFLPAGQGDRWIYSFLEAQRAPGDGATMSPERLRERIRTAAGTPDLAVQILDVRRYAFEARMADRIRVADVFLIGDAAHRLTPRGGMGLNTAVGDAINLAWKLAWVLKGWAPQRLLESYQAERGPVAEHNVSRSADPNGTRRSAADEVQVDLGGRIGHHWIARAGRQPVSTLDLVGPGLTEISSGRGARPVEFPGVSAPVIRRRVRPAIAAALGLTGDEGILVRPDGLVWSDAVLDRPVPSEHVTSVTGRLR